MSRYMLLLYLTLCGWVTFIMSIWHLGVQNFVRVDVSIHSNLLCTDRIKTVVETGLKCNDLYFPNPMLPT